MISGGINRDHSTLRLKPWLASWAHPPTRETFSYSRFYGVICKPHKIMSDSENLVCSSGSDQQESSQGIVPRRAAETEFFWQQALKYPTHTSMDYAVISHVHRLLEHCIKHCQTREEAIDSLAARGFSPLLCGLVWEGLKTQNPAFFIAYERALSKKNHQVPGKPEFSTSACGSQGSSGLLEVADGPAVDPHDSDLSSRARRAI
mmetsp:Transcript_7781/g.18635  ORF Transcript_7781/g.18635 Transcript_7781/m.18635 type:complete len:204 (+) Transcript_7781:3-614(+)